MTSTKLDLPPLTQQPIMHIDGTPDAAYPVRILRTYREQCNVRWEVQGLDEAKTLIYETMNQHQRERAALLDVAIRVLQKHAALVADVMNIQEKPDGEEED